VPTTSGRSRDGGLADHAGIDKCTVDGDVRTLEMMGIEIKEQLRVNDENRSITYSIVESPMTNLESHEATIASPDGAGSKATRSWRSDRRLGPLMEGSYTSGAGIKSAVEG
jgi:hypothetical protein